MLGHLELSSKIKAFTLNRTLNFAWTDLELFNKKG